MQNQSYSTPQIELSKAFVAVDNLTKLVSMNQEVDVLGSLFLIQDQLQRLEEAMESVY